jgi:hypothetical protein
MFSWMFWKIPITGVRIRYTGPINSDRARASLQGKLCVARVYAPPAILQKKLKKLKKATS